MPNAEELSPSRFAVNHVCGLFCNGSAKYAQKSASNVCTHFSEKPDVICEEDETSAILRIEWQLTEAHLQGFRKSVVFGEFFRAIGGFVKEIAEMRHYQLSNVVKRK